MATFRLACDPAKTTNGVHYSVVYHLDGRPAPMPERIFEARTVDAALAELEAYKTAAADLDQPVSVCIRVIAGRAPNGWNKAKAAMPFYHIVTPKAAEASA